MGSSIERETARAEEREWTWFYSWGSWWGRGWSWPPNRPISTSPLRLATSSASLPSKHRIRININPIWDSTLWGNFEIPYALIEVLVFVYKLPVLLMYRLTLPVCWVVPPCCLLPVLIAYRLTLPASWVLPSLLSATCTNCVQVDPASLLGGTNSTICNLH